MKKIDFIVTLNVKDANPNGDPLAENMPRTDWQGYGEISDVCIKRKIRNRMQDMGHEIFVKANDRADDGFHSLEERYHAVFTSKDNDVDIVKRANEEWMDIRAFGQVFTYDKKSIGVRGPVSVSLATSLAPIEITSMQITKSVNGMAKEAGKRSSDTMGMKHFVRNGIYVFYGSVNSYIAEKTGFSEADAEVLKECLRTLFANDASSARPEGSMEVKEIFWFTHSSKLGDVSSAKIRNLLAWKKDLYDEITNPSYEDYEITIDKEAMNKYEGLQVEIVEGM